MTILVKTTRSKAPAKINFLTEDFVLVLHIPRAQPDRINPKSYYLGMVREGVAWGP